MKFKVNKKKMEIEVDKKKKMTKRKKYRSLSLSFQPALHMESIEEKNSYTNAEMFFFQELTNMPHYPGQCAVCYLDLSCPLNLTQLPISEIVS